MISRLFGKGKPPEPSPPTRNCPHCNGRLEKVPQRKTKCPACGNYIYVRTRPSDRQRILVTEDMAKQINSEWALIHERQEAERVLGYLGIDDNEYNRAEKELGRKFGKPPTPRDVVWGVLNDRLVTSLGRGDWGEAKMIYFEQALILHKEGRDFFRLLQEGKRCELRSYQSQGVKRVEVLAGSCEKCKHLNGKVFTIKEALDTMPIPVKECENQNGWCRCDWLPIID